MLDPRLDAAQSLSQRYTLEAQAYAALWAPVLEPLIRTHLDALDAPPVQRALDLATGAGNALADLRQRFPSATVIGADRAAGMLRVAPQANPLVCMDASQLALVARAFDFILMAFALFHLSDPGVGLSEIHRVLRPGGMLALTTWAGDAESVATHIWNAALDAHGATPSEELEHPAQHELMDSTEKVEALLEAAGFVDVKATRREFRHPMKAGEFLQLKSQLGRNRRRLESLEPKAWKECMTQAQQRFASLARDDFTLQLPVVLASGRA